MRGRTRKSPRTPEIARRKDCMSDDRAKTWQSEENDRDPNPLAARGWKKWLFVLLASFFFVLGALGAFLPGLPATPFLLLTSYFLVCTSPRLNALLLRSRLFGPCNSERLAEFDAMFKAALPLVLPPKIARALMTFCTQKSRQWRSQRVPHYLCKTNFPRYWQW